MFNIYIYELYVLYIYLLIINYNIGDFWNISAAQSIVVKIVRKITAQKWLPCYTTTVFVCLKSYFCRFVSLELIIKFKKIGDF